MELTYQVVKKAKLYRTNDAIANISCGISSQVMNAVWGILSIAMYQFIFEHARIFSMPDSWWSYALLFVLVDLMYYWFHRASHEVNFLWNTAHVVHHQSEDYNFSVALRQSSFGGVFSMVFYLPLALIGFNTYAFITVKGLNLVYQFWIHTEAIEKLPRWFEYLFNTPSHHRVHHGRNPKYIDKNHAGTLMIWDRMFGTFKAEEERPTYGVTKPTQTWNPIWANVMPIVEMGKQLKNTKGLDNKLRVLFYKPGWQPAYQGGYQAPLEVNEATYTKFNNHPQLPLIRYLLVQFVVALAFTAYFLFSIHKFELDQKLFLAGLIVWSIAQLGILMENRKNWLPVEYLRLLIVSGSVIFFFEGNLVMIISIIFGLCCMIWLRTIQRKPDGSIGANR